jgi:hypothetical protein
MQIKNTYFGFTDNMSSMQKQRAENTLNNLTRYNGVVYTDKEFIYLRLVEGAKPKIEYNYSYYSRKLDGYTKPKNDYRIGNNDSFNINKTLYDYAVYLVENDFINEEKSKCFITDEQNKIELEKQKQIEQDRKEKEEKQAAIKAEEEFKNWHKEQANNYNNDERLELAREIFLQEIGEYNDLQLKRLLVLIENIDNINCREKLKDWLHSGNTASKKVFYHITGVKLPSTNKGTMPILKIISADDFTGIIPYKKRKEKSETITDTFYKIMIAPEPHFIEVTGEPINKYGLNMFITKSKEDYILSEVKSGFVLTRGETKEQLFDKLKKLVEQYTIENINKKLDEAIKKYGISPKVA